MIRRHGQALRAALMVADGVLATILSLVVYGAFAHPGTPVDTFLDVFWVRAAVYGIAWVGLLYVNGAYRLRAHWTILGDVRSVVRAALWLTLLGATALLLSASDRESSGWALLLFPLQAILAIAIRALVRLVFMRMRRRGFNNRFVLVLGTGPEAAAFTRMLDDHAYLGVRIVGYLGSSPGHGRIAERYLGEYAQMPEVLASAVIDEVAVCVPQADWSEVDDLVRLAHEQGKLIRVPLAVPVMPGSERTIEDIDGTAVLSFMNGPDELTSLFLKRLFDIAAASVALLLLSPLILGIALVLRLREGPGVIFSQTRVGLHGRRFTIHKFRTMRPDAEERYPELAGLSSTLGAAFKLVDDPRITPTGRWLRRYHLDELPQFVNVLRGDMSLVGPRPAPPREVEEYDAWHRRRLSVKPGITGLWQITTGIDEHFDDRAELDLAYINRWSLWLDLVIVLKTIPAVLRRPGH